MATPIPVNAATFSVAELCELTGGKLVGGSGGASSVTGVCTDSRSVTADQLFVPLLGERFDGHAHLEAAAVAGARVALSQRDVAPPTGMSLIRVACTLQALGRLAAGHRARWRAGDPRRRLVGLTGSAGKTTTKSALVALLEALLPGEVLGTCGNLNNRIGVPMTLLLLTHAHRFAVLELGTSCEGEIETLSTMVQPDVALITLIARAHSLGLGSIEAIAREKLALFAGLGPEGIAFGNADDTRVRAALAAQPRAIGYGMHSSASYQIVAREALTPLSARVLLKRPERPELALQIPLVGYAGALACAAAIACAETLLETGLDAARVAAALAVVSGRLQAHTAADGIVVLDDSYNANPASCRASIEAARELADQGGQGLVLVLGEMRELGSESEAAHVELGECAAEHGARLLIAVGPEAEVTAERASQRGVPTQFVEEAEEAAALAVELVRSGDVVLVKGSRGVKTETVVEALLAKHPGKPSNRRTVEGAP